MFAMRDDEARLSTVSSNDLRSNAQIGSLPSSHRGDGHQSQVSICTYLFPHRDQMFPVNEIDGPPALIAVNSSPDDVPFHHFVFGLVETPKWLLTPAPKR